MGQLQTYHINIVSTMNVSYGTHEYASVMMSNLIGELESLFLGSIFPDERVRILFQQDHRAHAKHSVWG